MSSPKFDRAKRENPELAPLLDKLMAYITHQSETGQTFIIPKLAAAAMQLNDGEAYVLLETLANTGVLKRAFNVYCEPSGMLLATVDSADKLDQIPYCDYCDCDHESHDLKLEIAFVLEHERNEVRRAA